MDTSKLVTGGDEPRVPFLRWCPTSNRGVAMGRLGNRRSIIFLPITAFPPRLNIELSPPRDNAPRLLFQSVSPRATWYPTFLRLTC